MAFKVDRVSIKRMCAGGEFQVEGADTEKAREEKLLVIPGGLVSCKEICIARTQGSGRKIVRDEFRQVERLRGMKCFPGGETRRCNMPAAVASLSVRPSVCHKPILYRNDCKV